MSKELLDRLARVESRLCQLFYFLGGNPHAKYDTRPSGTTVGDANVSNTSRNSSPESIPNAGADRGE